MIKEHDFGIKAVVMAAVTEKTHLGRVCVSPEWNSMINLTRPDVCVTGSVCTLPRPQSSVYVSSCVFHGYQHHDTACGCVCVCVCLSDFSLHSPAQTSCLTQVMTGFSPHLSV